MFCSMPVNTLETIRQLMDTQRISGARMSMLFLSWLRERASAVFIAQLEGTLHVVHWLPESTFHAISALTPRWGMTSMQAHRDDEQLNVQLSRKRVREYREREREAKESRLQKEQHNNNN